MKKLLKEYKEVKLQLEELQEREKELKDILKDEFREKEISSLKEDGYEFRYYTQNRKKIDKKGLIQQLEDHGLHDSIKVKYDIDRKKIREHISNGTISKKIVDEYVKDNEIQCFSFSEVKDEDVSSNIGLRGIQV